MHLAYLASFLSKTRKKGEKAMARTKSSVRGTQQKKIVTVKSYTKKNGEKVREHRRSTPN